MYNNNDIYNLDRLCASSQSCRFAARVAAQVAMVWSSSWREVLPGVGSLVTNLLETVLSGVFHPDNLFAENRFILEQSAREIEV